jgi:hypothetical protein
MADDDDFGPQTYEKPKPPRDPHPKGARLVCVFPNGCNPRSALFRIYADSSKRASTCQICSQPIRAKSLRLIFVIRLPRSYKVPKGGVIFEKKTFGHPECIVRDTGFQDIWDMVNRQHLDGAEQKFFRLCHDCRSRVETRDRHHGGHYRVYVGKHKIAAVLCEDCAKQPSWEHCPLCDMWFRKSEMTTAWEESGNGRFRGCKGCVSGGQFITVKEERQLRRYNEELELRYHKLRERLKEENAARASD